MKISPLLRKAPERRAGFCPFVGDPNAYRRLLPSVVMTGRVTRLNSVDSTTVLLA